MESITMDREVMNLRDSQIPRYAQLIYNGFWFSPEMEVLQGMIDSTQKNVAGVVRLELYKGNCDVKGRNRTTPCTVKPTPPSRTMMFTARRMPKGFIRSQCTAAAHTKTHATERLGADHGEKPWDGRFSEKTDKSVEAFTASIAYDRRLYPYDIAGSIAHCKMLAKVGVITDEESPDWWKGWAPSNRELDRGEFTFDDSLEDIHMHIEARLLQVVGKVAQKLHTARSRNDQVALDVRMYLRDETRRTIDLLRTLRDGAGGSGQRPPSMWSCPVTPIPSGLSRCCLPIT
jgi:hypothetical protein